MTNGHGPPRPPSSPPRRDDGLDVVGAFVTRVHGPAAAAALPAAISARAAMRVRLAGTAPCQWVVTEQMAVPRLVVTPIAWSGTRWDDAGDELSFWSRVVTTPDVDLTADAHLAAALDGFRELMHAVVIRTEAQAMALTAPPTEEQLRWPGVPSPADSSVPGLFEPPHFEGRRLVFHANLSWTSTPPAGPAYARVSLDVDTGAAAVERLAIGRRDGYAFVLRGRAYVDGGGHALVADERQADEVRGPRAAWRQAMLAEHASVASFSRASLELMSVGAPLDLVQRTHEAALDEIRHTQLSLDVLRRLGDPVVPPGPIAALGPRAATIAEVATTTLLDAAVNETLAAEVARVAASLARDPEVANVAAEIAADEARHAELAWDVVAWACAADPAAAEAVRALARELVPPSSSGSVSDDDACGQLTAATELEVWRSAFEGQVRACLTALDDS